MKLTGAQIIVKALEEHKVPFVAGIPGGANLPLYDALSRTGIRHILAKHEQAAGFIAQGYARVTGKPGVCLSSSGPGVTNLLTAIADAMMDSIPIIAITGQVPRAMIGTDAFQEIDTFGLTIPITKRNYFVRNAFELIEILPEAFFEACSGRPGPIVIDVPKDVFTEETEFDGFPEARFVSHELNSEKIQEIADAINHASKPILYAGGGVISSGASHLIRKLSEVSSIPVSTSLMGLGSFPFHDERFLGMPGMHGAPYTNLLLDEADLLLAVGVRFDDRAVGKAAEFCAKAKIIHIDIDASEFGKIKKPWISLASDAKIALERILPLVKENRREKWMAELRRLKLNHPKPGDLPSRRLMGLIDSSAGPDRIVTTDVGQHQMWAAQHLPLNHPGTFLTSGGLGTMGFGLPAALGAALASPESRVICITGDGSILMNIQELATLAELGLDVSILVLNNKHLGLVRQQQELFYGNNVYAAKLGDPDFTRIAAAFGIKSFRADSADDPAIGENLKQGGPLLIEIPIDPAENVFPMVPAGRANREMVGVE